MSHHRFLFSGNAQFYILNTKTNNIMHFEFSNIDSGGTEFTLILNGVNSLGIDELPYSSLGVYHFNERAKATDKISYSYKVNDKVAELIEGGGQYADSYKMALDTFEYLINTKQLPKIVELKAYRCPICNSLFGSNTQNKYFCSKHIDTRENLFDYFTFQGW